jgi:hypothetical protein
MQCREFTSVLEQQGLSPLPDAAQEHLAECLACQDFLADLDAIVTTASELPAEVDPPQRIWVSLRAQLEAEGLVKEPVLAVPDSSSTWLEGFRAWFTFRTLATAGVALSLTIAASLQWHKPHASVSSSPTPEVAKLAPPAPVSVPPAQPTAQPTIVAALPPTQPAAKMQQARRPVRASQLGGLPVLATAPSEDLYVARSAALNQAENDVPNSSLAGNPALDESLRKNLRTVNEFIAECQAHLKKYPNDTLAREYLDSALQQKAELIAAMLDSGRSEQ